MPYFEWKNVTNTAKTERLAKEVVLPKTQFSKARNVAWPRESHVTQAAEAPY